MKVSSSENETSDEKSVPYSEETMMLNVEKLIDTFKNQYMTMLQTMQTPTFLQDIREFQQGFTTDLPQIYQGSTTDLPQIRKYLAFYFLNIYQGFTTDLPQIYQGSTKDLPSLPNTCLLYTSPSPRDATLSRMPSSA